MKLVGGDKFPYKRDIYSYLGKNSLAKDAIGSDMYTLL